ncbi:hypothetical protein ACR9MW_07170 [Helicobacter pylori]
MNINKVFYHSSTNMNEVPDNSVDLIITSPPYFNIKDYAKNGTHSFFKIPPFHCKIISVKPIEV